MVVIDITSALRAESATDSVQLTGTLVRRKKAPCQIVHAHSDDRMLTWSYTVGLTQAMHHPEFLLTGLDPFLADSMLGRLANQVYAGRVFDENYLEKNLLLRLTCAFREVPAAMATVLMPLAHSDREPEDIRTLQCVYPDSHNRLPWRFGYNTSWQEAQPLFTSVLPLTKVEMRLLRAAEGVSRQPMQNPIDIQL